ncbi:hypothetical protein D9Q98_001327 [Chlorella vulgaris]|uniref:Rhodanese domain-containing protein n=1 Tax=Chlorella vulgaris TaxID=3077 RepID=A0A9D4TZV5_CHLVU|nr:hypothetical protein D9Q98_001327 [Chlorella vulgaris]
MASISAAMRLATPKPLPNTHVGYAVTRSAPCSRSRVGARSVCMASGVTSLAADTAHAVEVATLAEDASISSAVQAAEQAVEQVAAAAQEAGAGKVFAEAVSEAEAALKLAEQSSGNGDALALAFNEAGAAMNEASAAAASAGDVDLLAAVSAATAAIQGATSAALEASGVDAAAVAATAAAGAATATTLAQKSYNFLTTTEPSVLAYDALGAIAVAYFTPPLLKAGINAARGYAGDVLPTTALDNLASDPSAVLVDIRSAMSKATTGIPDLPDNDQLFELEYVNLEGSIDETMLRNSTGVEAEMTAVQIAGLKRAGTSKTLYLMDERGTGPAKEVAKQLRKRGFTRAFVVSGGSNAWIASKLSTRPWDMPALLPESAQSQGKTDDAAELPATA